MSKCLTFLLILNLSVTLVGSIVFTGPIIAGIVAVLGGGGGGLWYYEKTERCTDKWTSPNITGLQNALNTRLFGQHLVTDTVFKAVKGHLMNKSPQKALVLSFNGWTGCGKNFVSKLIAENAFKRGMESNFVNVIIATHHFPHKSDLKTYQDQLKKWVIGNVTKCGRSMFIFDEMDKMPGGLVDVLKPFLDHYQEVEGVDYRKSIFLFLSNTGARVINEEALKNWHKGNKREALTIKHMDQVINIGAFNTKGGFWHTSLIEKHLIDYFVPFIPLERAHVKQCAAVDLIEKGHNVTEKLLNDVADQLLYFPDDTKVFSKSGCKKVSSKVDYIIG